jgi:hypothetical protein
MRKTIEFQVLNNRFRFKCRACGSIRNSTIPQRVRRKSIRCQNCDEVTSCAFNRRSLPRKGQGGKVTVLINEVTEIEVYLYDISFRGVGLEMPSVVPRSLQLKVGQKVRLKCNWNQSLLSAGYFEVRNINGRKIGLRKTG